MKDLIVFGAGGLGRETMFELREINRAAEQYNLLGFADDGHIGQTVDAYPVLCGLEELGRRTSETCVVIAVGNPQVRRRLYETLRKNPALSFPTVAAPDLICSDRVSIGKGCVIGFGVTITVDIQIGDFVLISNGCNIGHDAQLRDFATLYPGVRISGNVTIGKLCEMGVGSCIIQGLSVGDGSVIGAGAAVVRNIPPQVTAVGVPAKVIRQREFSV